MSSLTGRGESRQKTLMGSKFLSMLLGGTLTMMVVSFMLMSDSIIAGVLISSDAVAGITLVTPLYFIAAFCGSIFSLGIPILYGRAMGEFDKEDADRVFGFGVVVSVLVGVLLLAAASFLGSLYLNSYHPSDSILHHGEAYLSWMRFTMFLLPIQGTLSYMVYYDGGEVISTVSSVVQGVGNIAGSILLGRILGTAGIGLASFIFTVVALAVLFVHFFKEKNSLHPKLCFTFSLLKQSVIYSIVDASSYLFLGLLTVILNGFVSYTFGSAYLVLVSLVAICKEFQLVYEGLGEAIRPSISIYLSENCLPGVEKIFFSARRIAVVEGIGMMILLILLAPVFPKMLDITDPALIAVSVRGVRILAAGSLFVSLLYLETSYLILLDKILFSLILCALRDFLLTAPLAVLLGIAFGFNGLFLAFALGPALAWIGALIYLRVRYPGDAPLLLGGRMKGKKVLLYELVLHPDRIVQTRDEIGDELAALSCDSKTVYRVMLLFEELLMLIYEKNKGKEILCEASVLIEDSDVRMIVRDSGEVFDIADPDMAVMSLRSYVVSNFAQEVSPQKGHLVAMSFNRNVFEIKR